MSSMPTPASSSRLTASAIAPWRERRGTLRSPSTQAGSSSEIGLSAEIAWSRVPPSPSWISRRSPPTCSLSSSDVPSAITTPWSTTAIWSARRSASSRYCVVRSTVVPCPTRASIASQSAMRLGRSRPVVGSSRKRIGGRATSAAARSRRRRIPPEYVRTRRSLASSRPKSTSSSRERSREAWRPMWYRRPTSSRFSKPFRFSSTAAYCPARPMLLRTSPGWSRTSNPATRAVPESGRINVVRMRTAVVLPAPFGPRRPKTLPVSAWRSTPHSAFTSP